MCCPTCCPTQQEPKPVKLSLNKSKFRVKNTVLAPPPVGNVFGDADDEDEDDDEPRAQKLLMGFDSDDWQEETRKDDVRRDNTRKRRRWDVEGVGDALDSFMDKSLEGAMGSVSAQEADISVKVDVGGSMMRIKQKMPVSGQVVTAEQLAMLSNKGKKKKKKGDAIYTASDWESEATSASEAETEDEEEE